MRKFFLNNFLDRLAASKFFNGFFDHNKVGSY